jgi:deoxycytidylate deaminase
MARIVRAGIKKVYYINKYDKATFPELIEAHSKLLDDIKQVTL